MCALCLIHVYTCLCMCSYLSFSLRSSPPSPRPLYSSVVFEMIRGNSMSVCGCLDERRTDENEPHIPPRGSFNLRHGLWPHKNVFPAPIEILWCFVPLDFFVIFR